MIVMVFCFFFLMIRRPPRSTLFPYTTALPISLAITIGLAVWQWDTNTGVIEGAMAIESLTLGLTVLFCAGGIAAVLDRKSTRLNSSHANISYAVFCLKKKTVYYDARSRSNSTI